MQKYPPATNENVFFAFIRLTPLLGSLMIRYILARIVDILTECIDEVYKSIFFRGNQTN